jgi:excisionase family DNA binding protein
VLTVRGVANELTVSATCVYQLIASGKLPCHRIGIGRGAIRVSETDLAEFLESSRRAGDSEATAERKRRGRARKFKHLQIDG